VVDEPEPEPHIRASASGQAQMPIAGRDMINYWGDAAQRHDIKLHFHHEADEVVLGPGQDTIFTVEIHNDRPDERQLAFKVIRLPEGTWRIRAPDGARAPKQGIVLVPPVGDVDVRVIVRCGTTAPPAGSREIYVQVTDVATGEVLDSRPKSVRVLSNPAMKLGRPEFTRQPGTTRYTARVPVINSGNCELAGTIVVVPPAPSGSLRPWTAECKGEFRLGPNERGSVTLTVAVTGQEVGARTWQVPLRVDVERDGVTLTPGHVELVADGLSHDLKQALAAVGPQVRRLLRWGRRPVTAPRGLLAAAAAGLVVLTALVGSCQGPGTATSAGPTAPASPSVSVAPLVPVQAEVAAYRADWPGLPCEPFHGDATGPTGSKCGFGDIELYLWSYPGHRARNLDRDKRSALAARGCASRGRLGTWIGPGGRAGQYVEYSIADEAKQCWARIWWDDGDADQASAEAAMLSAKWDVDLHGSWDPLRSVWLSHGYRFGR
jgi:hypothetical protein